MSRGFSIYNVEYSVANLIRVTYTLRNNAGVF